MGRKSILLKLGAQLEPRRSELENANDTLTQNIFMLLNNLNIRHNNCSEGDSKYKAVVAEMVPDELEAWYDELYQMLLLAKLELDNIGRIAKVQELRSRL